MIWQTIKLAVGAEVKVRVLDGSGAKIAYAWIANHSDPKTIRDLLVFHDCDQHIKIERAEAHVAAGELDWKPDSIRSFIGWTATGVGAHDLITVDPLHIEASVYWPDCCGIHGFIRDGRWVPA